MFFLKILSKNINYYKKQTRPNWAYFSINIYNNVVSNHKNVIIPNSEERSESLEFCKCEADATDVILLANFICCSAAAASLLKGLGEQRSHKYSSGRLFLLSNTQSTCCQTLKMVVVKLKLQVQRYSCNLIDK